MSTPWVCRYVVGTDTYIQGIPRLQGALNTNWNSWDLVTKTEGVNEICSNRWNITKIMLEHYEGSKRRETRYLFQEDWGAAAFQGSLDDDGYAVAQNVGLVHVVGGQEDGPILFVLVEHVPGGSPGGWVHAGHWLIKYHHLKARRTIPRPVIIKAILPVG